MSLLTSCDVDVYYVDRIRIDRATMVHQDAIDLQLGYSLVLTTAVAMVLLDGQQFVSVEKPRRTTIP